jgi:hypothetical protein
MAKATVFSITLAPELHDAFLAAAAASERPPAQVMRSLMREFIQKQQEPEVETELADSAAPAENITAVTDASAAGAAVADATPEIAQASDAVAAPDAQGTAPGADSGTAPASAAEETPAATSPAAPEAESDVKGEPVAAA